jgi:antitoxin component HigA of HigAB toxin-antitoxin module
MCVILIWLNPQPGAGQDRGESAPDDPASHQSMLRSLVTVERSLSAQPENIALRLERLRTLYFLGVADEQYLEQADHEIASIRDLARLRGLDREALLDAFSGAVEVVRGKHAFWPGNKLGHVRRGLAVLDRAVERAPGAVEVRNLRLLSTFYLPFFFGRGDTTREDLSTLASLLPTRAQDLPTHVWMAISEFVLEHGELPSSDRQRLMESRRRVAESADSEDGTQS